MCDIELMPDGGGMDTENTQCLEQSKIVIHIFTRIYLAGLLPAAPFRIRTKFSTAKRGRLPVRNVPLHQRVGHGN